MTNPKRRLLTALAVIGLLATAAAGAGCGGSGGDDGGAASTSTSASAGTSNASGADDTDRAVEYAECMRSNGVPDFPDPVDGRIMLRVGPGGIEADPAAMEAAQQACQELAPTGAGRADPQMAEGVFRFAACMRSNGVPEFPDPDVQGGGVRMQLPRGLDPQSPQFQEAQQACQGELQGAGPGGAP